MEVINTYLSKLFGYNLQYQEEWATDLITFDTGKEQRNQIWERPKRHWVLPYNVLQSYHRDKLKELCSRAKGIYNVFLFEDPYDYQCTLAECSITAIAAQVLFPLIKTYYGDKSETWSETKTRIQPATIYPPIVQVDNVTKLRDTDYTLDDDTGVVTFGAAPGVDKVITAAYRFYCPVRKEDDNYSETTIYKGVWNMGDIPIVEVIE